MSSSSIRRIQSLIRQTGGCRARFQMGGDLNAFGGLNGRKVDKDEAQMLLSLTKV